jgi:hypothetical protein
MVEAGQTCQADISLVAGIGIPRLIIPRRPAISVGVAKAERNAKEPTIPVATEPAVKTMLEVAAAIATEMPIATETAGSKRSDRIAAAHRPAAKSTEMAAAAETTAAKMAASTTKAAAAKMAASATAATTPTTACEGIGSRQASAGERQRSEQECNLRHHLLFHREALLFNAMAVS